MEEHELYFTLGSEKSFVEAELNRLNVSFYEEDGVIETCRLDHRFGFSMKRMSYHFDAEFLLKDNDEIF